MTYSTESGISYLTVGEHASLHAHHDTILSLAGDGSWQVIAATEDARRSKRVSSVR